MKKILVIVTIIFIFLNCQEQTQPRRASSSTQEKAKAPSKFIPGLAAVDVHGNLTQRGFTLQKNLSVSPAQWICRNKSDDYEYEAKIYGEMADKITVVEAMGINYTAKDTGEMLKSFLGFIASIPYDGSSPAAARSWVESNINSSSTTSFGNVKFEIIANPDAPRVRFLKISP